MRKFRGRTLVAAGLVAAILAAGTCVFAAWTGEKHITALFTSAVGVYPDSDVRVQGVKVGAVHAVRPSGKNVRVDLTVRDDVTLPANASAMVVTPSLVADRYVQLAPSYNGGPKLADGAVIPLARTATPVEVDELFSNLNNLMKALGPQGANANGAVTDLLQRSAQYLDSNGKPLGESIRGLGELSQTVNGSQKEVFSTVDNLAKFTGMLSSNDQQVNEASQRLSSVTAVLAAQRNEFSGALNELTDALGIVQGFVHDNRDKIKSNVDKLAQITKTLNDQKASLAEALDTAPNALTNIVSAYNPQTHTIDARGNLNEFRAVAGASEMPAMPLPVNGGGR